MLCCSFLVNLQDATDQGGTILLQLGQFVAQTTDFTNQVIALCQVLAIAVKGIAAAATHTQTVLADRV